VVNEDDLVMGGEKDLAVPKLKGKSCKMPFSAMIPPIYRL
jgi:hypothetical protein